jgi:iron(III) transport system substrate-binding protein
MLRHLTALSLLALAPLAQAADLVVYSARNEQLIRPIFERYTAETGVKIDFITDKEGVLLQRLEVEGAATPADLLLTVDAGNLWQAAEQKLLRPLSSKPLTKNIPAHLRDPQNRWFGLSVRARTLVYSTERVKPADLSTYEALAAPQWKKRLCLRTSKKVYNQSLVAMMLSELGAARAESVVAGWVANLATPPLASDNEVIEAIAAGRCDVGLVNTYYYGRLLREKPELPVKLFFPNQRDGKDTLKGVHVNVAGAGVTAHAKHPEAAQKFLEWASSGVAQALFAGVNQEYPANPAVAPDARVAAWGTFKQDLINVSEAGRLQAEAVKLMDRVGYR